MPANTKTGLRVQSDSRGACAKCAKPGGEGAESKLMTCKQCGTAAYCSRECQRAHWKTHKVLCKLTSDMFTIEDGDGIKRLLFDRAFGGAYSLFHRARFDELGTGVLLADLSHPVAEYCGASRAQDDPRGCRTIKFTYVPKRTVGGLAHESLAANQPDTLLDGAMEQAAEMAAHCQTDADRFLVLALREPKKRGLSVHLMMNWLDAQHSVIPLYHQLRGGVSNRNELTLEWEYRVKYSTPMQEMLHAASAPIGPNFYAECIQLYQDRKKRKDPLFKSETVPPLALCLDLRAGSADIPAHMIGSHAAATPPLLHKCVRVKGLVSKVELNGLTGIAQSFDTETGRYAIVLDQRDDIFRIKGGNLELCERDM